LLYKLSLRQRKDIEREVPFPDDVQVILRGDSLEKGNLFIGNIEAARFLVKRQADKALVIHHPKPSKLAVNSFH